MVRFALLAITSLTACTRAQPAAEPPPKAEPLPLTTASIPPAKASPPGAKLDRKDAATPCEGAVCERRAWRTRLGWDDDCENHDADAGVDVFVLDAARGRSLVRVICSLGAYQGSARMYLWDAPNDGGPGRAKLLTFPVPDSNEKGRLETTSDISNFADWDDKKKEIRIWRRYRGPGDCGSLGRYVIEGDRVVARELRQQIDCNGKIFEPEKWPLFRAKR